MSKLAVDVVLFPDERVTNLTIEANRSAESPTLIERLNATNCLPHISLLQGVMDESVQVNVGKSLGECARNEKQFQLVLTHLEVLNLLDGLPAAGFAVAPTTQLQELHERVATLLTDITNEGVSEEMFFEKPIRPDTMSYVASFREGYAFGSFHPHITISVGSIPTLHVAFPVHFTARSLPARECRHLSESPRVV